MSAGDDWRGVGDYLSAGLAGEGLLLGRPGLWVVGGVEGADSDDVVHSGFGFEPGPVAFLADVADFAASADGFDPTERFLDPFTDPLRHAMTIVAGSTSISHKPFCVIVFVGSDCAPPLPGR